MNTNDLRSAVGEFIVTGNECLKDFKPKDKEMAALKCPALAWTEEELADASLTSLKVNYNKLNTLCGKLSPTE